MQPRQGRWSRGPRGLLGPTEPDCGRGAGRGLEAPCSEAGGDGGASSPGGFGAMSDAPSGTGLDCRAQHLCCIYHGGNQVQPPSPSGATCGKPRDLAPLRGTGLGLGLGLGLSHRPLSEGLSGAGAKQSEEWVRGHAPCLWGVCVCVHICVCTCVCSVCVFEFPSLSSPEPHTGGAGGPVRAPVSYLRRNCPWCARVLGEESYKDNFLLSIKPCLGGLPGLRGTF